MQLDTETSTPDERPTVTNRNPAVDAFLDELDHPLAFNAPSDELFSVGVSRFTGTPAPLEDETVLFGFATGLKPPGGGQ